MFQQCLNCVENNFASFIFAVWLSSVQSSVFTLRPSPRSAQNVPKAWAGLRRLEIRRPIHIRNPKTVGDWISKLSWLVPVRFYLVTVLFFSLPCFVLIFCWWCSEDETECMLSLSMQLFLFWRSVCHLVSAMSDCFHWYLPFLCWLVLFVIWWVQLAVGFTGIYCTLTGWIQTRA